MSEPKTPLSQPPHLWQSPALTPLVENSSATPPLTQRGKRDHEGELKGPPKLGLEYRVSTSDFPSEVFSSQLDPSLTPPSPKRTKTEEDLDNKLTEELITCKLWQTIKTKVENDFISILRIIRVSIEKEDYKKFDAKLFTALARIASENKSTEVKQEESDKWIEIAVAGNCWRAHQMRYKASEKKDLLAAFANTGTSFNLFLKEYRDKLSELTTAKQQKHTTEENKSNEENKSIELFQFLLKQQLKCCRVFKKYSKETKSIENANHFTTQILIVLSNIEAFFNDCEFFKSIDADLTFKYIKSMASFVEELENFIKLKKEPLIGENYRRLMAIIPILKIALEAQLKKRTQEVHNNLPAITAVSK